MPTPVAQGSPYRSRRIVWLVLTIFFVISLLTNILGPIIPDIIRSFRLSLTAAAFLPFSFFIAYGVMSIPAGTWIERFTEKPVILAAFGLSCGGSLLFASAPAYASAVASLFMIGVGMAMLQVAINPLLRVAGGEEHFAFNSALAQFLFGLASFASPRVYSYLVVKLGSGNRTLPAVLRSAVPLDLPWISLYWLFVAVTLAMFVTVLRSEFPTVRRTEQEQAGSWSTYRLLPRNPVVVLYFVSVFAYVGSEQGTANWMALFLDTYHHYNPRTVGAMAVSWFWGLMTTGCFIGMLLLKFFDSRRILIGGSAGALIALTVALFGRASQSVVAFPAIGLFASVMWPVIISLGLNSLAEQHGAFTGILCTAIIGGAIVPLLIGQIGDHFGLRAGMLVLYLSFGWVLSVGFWAKPIVSNVRTRAGVEEP